MSHFTVVVCLRDPVDLPAALEPFDENLEVPEYRRYLENPMKDYRCMLELYGRGIVRNHTGPDELNVAQVLSDYHDGPVIEDGDDGTGSVLYFQWTTYNQAAKWDWYTVGGRWTGYFVVKPEHVNDPELIRGEPGLLTAPNLDLNMCDGGPKRALDLVAMRERAADRAADEFDRYRVAIGGLAVPEGWSTFQTRVDQVGIDQARKDYRAQPAIQKLEQQYGPWWDCPVDRFAVGRDAYVRERRESATVPFALLTLEGEWVEAGRMGWWAVDDATDSSRALHRERVNAYLESLSDDVYLVVVDCHI